MPDCPIIWILNNMDNMKMAVISVVVVDYHGNTLKTSMETGRLVQSYWCPHAIFLGIWNYLSTLWLDMFSIYGGRLNFVYLLWSEKVWKFQFRIYWYDFRNVISCYWPSYKQKFNLEFTSMNVCEIGNWDFNLVEFLSLIHLSGGVVCTAEVIIYLQSSLLCRHGTIWPKCN